jgi:hypothetical protein
MSLLKKVIAKLYVVLLMAFAVWYGHFIYPLIFGFEGKEEAAESLRALGHAGTKEERLFVRLIAEQAEMRRTELGYRTVEEPYIEGHFHHVGFSMQRDKTSSCVRCHGNVPHSKSKELRSFLNMHSYFLACETCHIAPEGGAPGWQFRWYDKDDGEVVSNPRALLETGGGGFTAELRRKFPTYGNYGAKIAPGTEKHGRFEFLHGGPRERAFAERYLKERDRLRPEQKSQMQRVIHRRLSEDPMQCSDCHQEEDPYVPFAELGYPPGRIDELTRTAVVGMIDKYFEFFIPELVGPGGETPEGEEAEYEGSGAPE